MTESELKMLADHMGHNVQIHTDIYWRSMKTHGSVCLIYLLFNKPKHYYFQSKCYVIIHSHILKVSKQCVSYALNGERFFMWGVKLSINTHCVGLDLHYGMLPLN